MRPAQQVVRAWEIAQHEVSLPERFERSLSFGGQYFLWDRLLQDWLDDTRADFPDLAMRVTAGAWTRLNRDLAESELDMIVVHDPVFRRDINAERLFEDRLILVTAGDPASWKDDFVRVDWGRSVGLEIASRLGVAPKAGLVLDLGQRSGAWLIANRMAGYMPEYLVAPQLNSGELVRVDEAPGFDFPAYVCWRNDLDPQLAADMVLSLQNKVSREQ